MKAIILAAGTGKRLHSEEFNAPKVLRKASGRPLLGYVLDSADFIPPEDVYIVVGFMKERVMEYAGKAYNYIVQKEQLGTGHAVLQAAKTLESYNGDVIVLYGDMPLFRTETYRSVIDKHVRECCDCTILTADVENPPDYGRIIRDEEGKFVDIVEKKDCTTSQLDITELNLGIHVYRSSILFESLKMLDNDNAQQEYYLTDVPGLMLKSGYKVCSHTIYDRKQIYGVNTPSDLVLCERIIAERD